jgi:hypothetical protein
MKILDPGHTYEVDIYDEPGFTSPNVITFMKREGENYPGNKDSYPGTNCQELIRVLIDRLKYLNNQIPCPENKDALQYLRQALLSFEIRAAKRHQLFKGGNWMSMQIIETLPVCHICGHIIDLACKGHQ